MSLNWPTDPGTVNIPGTNSGYIYWDTYQPLPAIDPNDFIVPGFVPDTDCNIVCAPIVCDGITFPDRPTPNPPPTYVIDYGAVVGEVLNRLQDLINESHLNATLRERLNSIEEIRDLINTSLRNYDLEFPRVTELLNSLTADLNAIDARVYDGFIEVRDEFNSSLAASINGVIATFNGNLAQVNETMIAFTNNYMSYAEWQIELDSIFRDPDTGEIFSFANAVNELRTVAGKQEAYAQDLTTLEGTVNDPETGLATTRSEFIANKEAVATITGAHGRNLEALDSAVYAVDYRGEYLLDRYGNRITNSSIAYDLAATSVEALEDDAGNIISVNALGKQVNGVYNEVFPNGINGETEFAAVEQRMESFARHVDKPLALYQTSGGEYTLDPNLDSNGNPRNTRVTDQAVLDRYAESFAEWTVKIDVNGLVSGVGLRSTGDESEFIINANTFAIGTPEYPPGQTITYVDGKGELVTTSNGFNPFILTTEVINNRAYPKIAMNAEVFIRDATITTAKIENGAINNAKIGKVIKSDDFNGVYNESTGHVGLLNSGTKGWAIGKGGHAVFNDVVVRGNITANKIIGEIVDTGHIKNNTISDFADGSYRNSTWSPDYIDYLSGGRYHKVILHHKYLIDRTGLANGIKFKWNNLGKKAYKVFAIGNIAVDGSGSEPITLTGIVTIGHYTDGYSYTETAEHFSSSTSVQGTFGSSITIMGVGTPTYRNTTHVALSAMIEAAPGQSVNSNHKRKLGNCSLSVFVFYK